MIKLKTEAEISQIQVACNMLSDWMQQCITNLYYGGYECGLSISEEFLDYVAYLDDGEDVLSTPFSTQKSGHSKETYRYPICVSINDEVVHSRPTSREFKPGDIVTIDAGISYRNWCADMARTTIFAGDTIEVSTRSKTLISACAQALADAKKQCYPGNTIGNIAAAIAAVANQDKLGTIIHYTGHGIGRELHEEPKIPNRPGIFPRYDSTILRTGMVFCLEPMFTLGSSDTVLAPDNWKVWTQDGSLAVHFEDQIVITDTSYRTLTT